MHCLKTARFGVGGLNAIMKSAGRVTAWGSADRGHECKHVMSGCPAACLHGGYVAEASSSEPLIDLKLHWHAALTQCELRRMYFQRSGEMRVRTAMMNSVAREVRRRCYVELARVSYVGCQRLCIDHTADKKAVLPVHSEGWTTWPWLA